MRLPLYWKLVLGFGVIIISMILVHGYILVNLDSVYSAVTTSLESDVAAIDGARRIHTLLNEEEWHLQKHLLSGDPVYRQLFLNARSRTTAGLDSLGRVLRGARERAIFAEIRRTHRWVGEIPYRNISKPFTRSAQIADSLGLLHDRLDRIVQLNQTAITGALAAVERNTTDSIQVGVLLMVIALLATVAVAFFITRAISLPLARLRQSTERIARGEYHTIPVRSRDEIGMLLRAFNAMSDRLKRIDEYKAEVMQQISHELRTPLQSMHAAYYMLAEQIAGPLNDRQRSLLSSIRDNVDTLSTFSNQFLDLAKIEAGMMEFHPHAADLLSIVTPVINNARLVASQKDITISLAAQAVPAVYIDAEKVTTVVSNLLSNAVKFTPRGGTITVTVGPCSGGARVAVKDSGIGIDADDLPKLFTKFFQARNAAQANIKGTGVGLALVKAIVDGHGGKVYACSTIGVGSTFTVELPGVGDRPAHSILQN